MNARAVHPVFARARALGRPLVLGHRGCSGCATENTLESFAAARDLGADGIELDVQMCASGELVVFHDENLARLAGRGERLSSMPWSDLQTLPVGRDGTIPQLQHVLHEFSDPEFVINIEVKVPMLTRPRAIVDRTIAAVAYHRAEDRVIISSFNPLAVDRVLRTAPRMAAGFLFHVNEPRMLQRAWRALPRRPQALHAESPLATSSNLDAWREQGLHVATWTVDARERALELARRGVYAIITNQPGTIARALRSKTSVHHRRETTDPE